MSQHAEHQERARRRRRHGRHDSRGDASSPLRSTRRRTHRPVGRRASSRSPSRADRSANGGEPTAGFVLTEGAAPPASSPVSTPGPPLVLQRNEPVEITVVNRLPEATALHWHGMELDSYLRRRARVERHRPAPGADDRAGRHVRRPIHAASRGHVHLPHAPARLPSTVVRAVRSADRGGRRARRSIPATDHVFVIGRRGVTSEAESIIGDPASVVLNGERAPRFVWKAGDVASRAAGQHHAGRHLHRLAADRGRARDVEAAHEGRRRRAERRVHPRSRRARRLPSARPTTSSTSLPPAGPPGSRCAAPAASGRCRVR